MEALGAIASSLSTRRGGEMTMGIASPRGVSPRAESRASAESSPPASPRPPPMYSRHTSPLVDSSHRDDSPSREYIPRNASPRRADSPQGTDRRADSLQRSPSPVAMVTVAPASHAINPWVPLLLKVKEMPKKGNTTPYLCLEMRAVLNQADRMVLEYCREKTKLLVDSIYDKGLETQTKIDDNKTTLGIVFTDDMVATVLPGGPAFQAGLRKGDRILKVRTAPMRCHLQPWASSLAVCSASALVLRPLVLASRRLTEEFPIGTHLGSS